MREDSVNQQLKNELAEALRSRDDFISIASHEMKTPLTSLSLQIQSLKKMLDRNNEIEIDVTKLKKLVDQMDHQNHKLCRLIEDLLDISRIRTGKLALKKELFSLEDLIKETCDKIRDLYPGKKDLIHFDHGKEKTWGLWDRDRMEQVLNNLIVNALKFGNNQSFEISVSHNKHSAFIKVRDHGIGIPKEMLLQVFDKYKCSEVSSIDMTGLGLGLYISQQIIKAHHGRIWAESSQGDGAIFWIEVPIRS